MAAEVIPVTGRVTFTARTPPRDSAVEFADDRRTFSLPMRAALPILGKAQRRDDLAPQTRLLAGSVQLGLRLLTLDAADGEKLSTALADAGVISAEEAEAGFVTVVNGEAADYNKDGSWWCLTDAAGEMTSVGVADIELHDGDSYAFTYTK